MTDMTDMTHFLYCTHMRARLRLLGKSVSCVMSVMRARTTAAAGGLPFPEFPRTYS